MSRRRGRILLRCDIADYTKIRRQRREGTLEVYLTYRNDFRTSSPFKPANDYLLASSPFPYILHTQSSLCERERKRGERWKQSETEQKRERGERREGNVEGVPRLGFIRRAPAAAAAAAALRREITRGPLKRAIRARYDSNVPSFMYVCVCV